MVLNRLFTTNAASRIPLSSTTLPTYFPTAAIKLPVLKTPTGAAADAVGASAAASGSGSTDSSAADGKFETRHVSRFGFGGPMRNGVHTAVLHERLRNFIKRGGSLIDFAARKCAIRFVLPPSLGALPLRVLSR